ncbi:uncharacterized protein ACIBXB_012712 isoform 2-T2 [Morphnus guianensis]
MTQAWRYLGMWDFGEHGHSMLGNLCHLRQVMSLWKIPGLSDFMRFTNLQLSLLLMVMANPIGPSGNISGDLEICGLLTSTLLRLCIHVSPKPLSTGHDANKN